MSSTFPSRGELKFAGISFIIAQICFGISTFLYSIDYDIYNIQQQSDVITLHDTLSSKRHRTETEIAIALIFISFPFLLISLHGLNKLLTSVFRSTPGEMAVYILEKSYIIWITVSNVIIPALWLVGVSFNWSFTEQTPSEDVIPTGYYMQYYVVLYLLEMIDGTAVADATFMITLFLFPTIMRNSAKNGNHKLQRVIQAINPEICPCKQCGLFLAVSFMVIFAIVLFEFADMGFLSPMGHAKFLMIWSFIWKLLIGVRLFLLGRSNEYERIKSVVDGGYNITVKDNVNSDRSDREISEKQNMIRDEEFEDEDDDFDPDEEGEDDDFAPTEFKINLKAKHHESFMAEMDPVTPMAKGPNIRL